MKEKINSAFKIKYNIIKTMDSLYYCESICMVLIKFSVPIIIALYYIALLPKYNYAYMCQMLAENHIPELYNLVHSFG